MGEVVTHLAGPVIDWSTEEGVVTRQRCSWCGAVLVDECSWLIAVPTGQDPRVPGWMPGKFVDVVAPDGTGGMWSENAWTQGPAPDTACLRMPLEVTA